MESAILTPKRTEYGKSIRKAYESGEIKESRHNMTELEPRTDGISNTLTTVQKDNLLIEVKQIGNMDTDRENFENPQCGRVYDSSGLSPTINTCQGGQRQPKILEVKKDYTKIHCGLCSHFMEDDCNLCGCNKYDGPTEKQIVAMRGRNPDNPSDRTAGSQTEQRLEPNSQGICNTLTSVQKDNMVLEKDGVENEERIIEILQILRQENGEKAFFEWSIRGLWCILAEEVLQQRVYAKIILERWVNTTDIFQCTYNSKAYKFFDITKEQMRDMWKDWEIGCSSQGRKLSEQQSREFNDFVQKLPFETAQKQRYVYCLWKSGQGIGLLQQALLEVQKIWESNDCKHGALQSYGIRKLTPKEIWRLMGFSDEDFYKAEEVNSNTQLYKQAGNSIVKNVLMAIFGQMIPGNENLYKEL